MVFYGSQTGTAEEFSNRLAKDAHRYGMKAMVADPEEYDMVHWHYRTLLKSISQDQNCSILFNSPYFCHYNLPFTVRAA